MTRPALWARRATLAVLILFLIAAAYLLLWTTYMVYDDEGYVLYSLRTFATQGHLYDRVYSQYGPFFFVLYGALHQLGLAFTNTTGRVLALVCWVGAAAACGALVWRATHRRLVATAATLVAVFVHLWDMSSEPSHPGGLIALVTAVAAWWGLNRRWSSGARAAAISALAAMLVLTKINVGLFLYIGAGAWWLLNIPGWGGRAWGRWAVAAMIALVPLLLMHGSWTESWVRVFTAVVSTGAAAAVLASATGEHRARGRDWAPAVAAALAVAVVTFSVVLATGTSPAELLQGVLLGPLRHPSIYWVPLTWRPGSVVLAVLAVPAAAIASRMPIRRRGPVLVALRLVLIAAYAGCLGGVLPLNAAAFVLSYGLATCWIFVLPAREDDALANERSWLALLLVMQALHAFPVAGSQIAWGTFLWVPLAVLGTMDAGVLFPSPGTRRIALGAVAAATLALCINTATVGVWRYWDGEDLQVSGAEHLRLPASFASSVRMLVRNAQVHADVLFSLPGMMSFNAWSGVPPPTTENATHWFNLLSPAEQEAILHRLQASPRAALIVQRYVFDLLKGQHFIHPTPLLDWLLANYRPLFRADTYEFWVPKSRTVVPVDAARLYVGGPGSPLKYKLDATIAPAAAVRIAGIEFRQFAAGISLPQARLTNANARIISVPVDEAGAPIGKLAATPLPFTARGLVRVEIFTNALPARFAGHGGIVCFLDAAGRRVAEARLLN